MDKWGLWCFECSVVVEKWYILTKVHLPSCKIFEKLKKNPFQLKEYFKDQPNWQFWYTNQLLSNISTTKGLILFLWFPLSKETRRRSKKGILFVLGSFWNLIRRHNGIIAKQCFPSHLNHLTDPALSCKMMPVCHHLHLLSDLNVLP